MNTNIAVKLPEDSIVNGLPQPTRAHELVALFGFACLKRHNGNCFVVPTEDNPILNVLKIGMYPDKAVVEQQLSRPFRRYIDEYGPNYTFLDVAYDWLINHQNDPGTPTSIVRITNSTSSRDGIYFCERLTTSSTKISVPLFNHLGHTLKEGDVFCAHNNELILKISLSFLSTSKDKPKAQVHLDESSKICLQLPSDYLR